MKIKGQKAHVADVDMTPMIDIVFQLIAFFMVITNFEQTQADERVKLPKDPLVQPLKVKRKLEVVVNIGFDRDKDGKKLSDAIVFYAGEKIPVLNFGPKLNQEARIYTASGTSLKEVTIVIRADADTPTGLVQELIKLAQEAKFEKFAMKAKQESKE